MHVNTLPDIICNLLRHGTLKPDPWVRYWQKGGRPRPTVDALSAAADRLGIAPDAVAQALYGADLAQTAIAGEQEARQRAAAAYIRNTPARKARRAAWGKKHTMFQGDREAFHAHQRATLDANRAKAAAAQGKVLLGPKTKALASIRRARNSLKAINQTIDRLNRQLARSAKLYSKPWHVTGFPSLRKWAAATPEGAEHRRLWWQTKSHNRDARLANLPGTFSTTEWRTLMSAHGYHCAYCGRHRSEFRNKATRTDMEIDHVYPIGHPWARNDESNIVPACKACNASKSDEDLIAWASRTGVAAHPWAMQKYHAIQSANTKESACQA